MFVIKLFFIQCLFLIVSLNLISQDTTYFNIEFNEAIPVWEYDLYDDNVPSDSIRARYLDFLYTLLDVSEQGVFLSSVSNKNSSTSFDYHGGIFVKIDPKTGVENCRYSFNQYSIDNNQSFFPYSELGESTIDFYGTSKLKDDITNPGPWWVFANGSIYRHQIKKINISNCSLEKDIIDLADTTGLTKIPPSNVTFYNTEIDSIFLRITTNAFRGASASFYLLDSKLKIDSLNKIDINYDPETQPTNFNVSIRSIRLNKSRTLLYIYQDDPSSTKPINSELIVVNTENPENIFVTSITDLTDIVYDLVPNSTTTVIPENEFFLLSGVYNAPEGLKSWLIWVNEDGELINALNEISIDDHQYLTLRKIYLEDDRAILFASPTISGEYGFDIINLNSEGNISKSGSLTTKNGIEYTNFFTSKIYGDKLYTVAKPNKKNTKLFAFNIKDLGISVPTNINYNKQSLEKISMFPNPTSNILNLEFDSNRPEEELMVHIRDLQSRLLLQQAVTSPRTQIHVNNLEKGVYTISVLEGSNVIWSDQWVKL